MERLCRSICLVLFVLCPPALLSANTGIIVTPGASVDGSVILSYTRDSNTGGGFMYFAEGATYPPDSKRKIMNRWDDRESMGMYEVPAKSAIVSNPGQSYRITGHMNEKQVVIGESSFTPRVPSSVNFYGGALDTGNLIGLTLERASSAREAVEVIDALCREYGFYGPGKSLAISDRNEAWIMEMFSKGEMGEGIIWVALKIPDGYISGYTDNSRIGVFPRNDKENCLYSEDVIAFARQTGMWDGNDEDFSFADVYAPVDSTAIRQTDGRLWSIFRKASPEADKYKKYIFGDVKRSYGATGTANGIITNRLPLWVRPEAKLSVRDVMSLMRDHYEGTELDMTRGIWAGPFGNPYRLRPDNATARDSFYHHERPVSVQYTGYSFVAQSRNFLPDEIGGVSWFGVDDTYMTVYLPVYSGVLEVPSPLREDMDPVSGFSMDSAYWLFNLLSNFSAIRYDQMIIDIQKVQRDLENDFALEAERIEREALEKAGKSGDSTREFLTVRSRELSEIMMKKWTELFHYLFVKYKDGEVRLDSADGFKKDSSGFPLSPKVYGYPADWALAMIDKDNPPDLKRIYTDDELMALFATNNRNALLYISLVLVIVILSASTALLAYKYRKASNR